MQTQSDVATELKRQLKEAGEKAPDNFDKVLEDALEVELENNTNSNDSNPADGLRQINQRD